MLRTMLESGRYSFPNDMPDQAAAACSAFLKRRLAAVFCALALFTAAAAQNAEPVSKAEQAVSATPVTLAALADYMSGLRQGWARFSQLNTDGTVSTGSILFRRPSFARIEYDPPASGLVIAESFRVAVFDLKSNTEPMFFLLGSTPLYFLLKNSSRIDDPKVLTDHRIGAASSEVALRSPSNGGGGQVRLIFRHDPIRLAGWVYFDRFGQQTRMTLGELVPNIQIDPDMFDINGQIRRMPE